MTGILAPVSAVIAGTSDASPVKTMSAPSAAVRVKVVLAMCPFIPHPIGHRGVLKVTIRRIMQPGLSAAARNEPFFVLSRRRRQPHLNDRRAVGHFAGLGAAAFPARAEEDSIESIQHLGQFIPECTLPGETRTPARVRAYSEKGPRDGRSEP